MDKKRKVFTDYKPKDFLYKRKGPWPQPSPAHPLGEAPAVLHIPLIEWADWWLHIGSRFIYTLGYSPIAYLRGIFNGELVKLDDDEFMHLFEKSMLSKFIIPGLDDRDRAVFRSYLDKDPDADYYILDFEIADNLESYPNMYISGTKCLLVKTSKYKYKPIAIYVDKTKAIFEPTDGDAWELSKYYVLQGASLGITLVVHSILHFPLDAINAVSKTAVPKEHILYKLIKPHLRFTLPLENAVLTFSSSVIIPKWYKPYTPHPADGENLRKLLVDGFRGINGDNSYKEYRYPMTPNPVHSDFGDFRDRYYEVFYNFVSKVLKDCDKEDQIIIQWAHYISHWVPGFPNGDEIKEGDNLIKAVAFYLWAVTIGHAVDHHTFCKIDVRRKPLRLRQAPPKDKNVKIDRKKLNTFWDIGKYIMCQLLFFKDWTVTFLKDIDYKFDKDYQQKAQKEFFKDLEELDEKLKEEGINYMDYKDIPSSIQY